MTVSHAIVILLILTCQLTPKSNSHISQSFVASVYKPAFFQCLFNPVSCTVQQCIQISTRINSSSVHTYIFVCSTLRVILQGFVDPIMQHGVRIEAVFASLHKENIWSNPHASSHPDKYNNSVNRIISKEEEREDPRRDSSIFEYSGVSTFLQELQDFFEYSVSTRNPATPSNSAYRINSSTRNTTTTRLIPCRSVQGIFQ